jgi:hypothetical protein
MPRRLKAEDDGHDLFVPPRSQGTTSELLGSEEAFPLYEEVRIMSIEIGWNLWGTLPHFLPQR